MIEEDIKNGNYFKLQEDILKLVRGTTLNTNADTFFRLIIASNLTQVAGSMRAKIKDCLNEETVINMYTCGVMPSGSGKSQSQNKVLDEVTKGFRNTFEKLILPTAHRAKVKELAQTQLLISGQPINPASLSLLEQPIEDEYKTYGSYIWRLSSGTEAAIRQERKKIQLQGCGALNVFVDEIGYNLISNTSLNTLGLCLYDSGNIEASLTKVTKENNRYPERDIPIPVNFLWMGDPTKLFDSGETEKAFFELLGSGYGRRTFFGIGANKSANRDIKPQEVLAMRRTAHDPTLRDAVMNTISSLANMNNLNKVILLKEPELLYLYEYEIWCKNRSYDVSEITDSIYKIELSERMYKVLKLAGTYAFIDNSNEITKEHLIAAMKLAEDSGRDLYTLLHAEKPYVKLAKYLASVDEPKSKADISEALPFFKTPKLQSELLERACEWGFSHDITIKTINRGKLEFYVGESMKETDLGKLRVSVSNHEAFNYINNTMPFTKLKNFGSVSGLHWCTHHFTYDANEPEKGNRRADQYVNSGFNLVVLDIDDGDSIQFIQEVLQDYKYVLYTTKRHTDEHPRCRVILPIKYDITLGKEDYKKFMLNVYDSLPFKGLDTQTCDRARKWLTNKGTVIEHPDGVLLDPRPFIPNTSENELHNIEIKKFGNIDKIQRWFLSKMEGEGNRNNMFIRYAFMLKERGETLANLEKEVLALNAKIDSPLPISELENTVLKSIRSKY